MLLKLQKLSLKFSSIYFLILLLTIIILNFNERELWGSPNISGIWCSETQSICNSQYLFDPYTFTHIIHGFLYYFAFIFVKKKFSLIHTNGFIIATVFESLWELIENSEFIISKYRTATLSLDYFGDSLVNSITDILASSLGFLIASAIPISTTVLLMATIELILIWWIKDSLFINIIQLTIASDAIKKWQLTN